MLESLHVLPADWQAQPGRVAPGDLSQFVQEGFGGGMPLVVRPWDRLEDAVGRGGYYGLDQPGADPILNAPTTLAYGGTVYFDSGPEDEALARGMDLLGLGHDWKKYAVFLRRSEDTQRDRYLDQMRIVGFGALSQLFGIPSPAIAALPEQTLGVNEAVRAFLAWQLKEWGDPDYLFGRGIAGTLGGDGDWAKEALAFGMTAENNYWQVYRVWSRPYLVTK